MPAAFSLENQSDESLKLWHARIYLYAQEMCGLVETFRREPLDDLDKEIMEAKNSTTGKFFLHWIATLNNAPNLVDMQRWKNKMEEADASSV